MGTIMSSADEDDLMAAYDEDDNTPSLEQSLGPAFEKLFEKGKERGYVTAEELNDAISVEQGPEAIEEAVAILSENDINLLEKEDVVDEEVALSKETPSSEDEETEEDALALGRTNDPVRMYLREMGIVELLTREGEIAIAKRIEAGWNVMMGGLSESSLTMKALAGWHNALLTGEMLLRDIIDLEATYEADPSKKSLLAALEKKAAEKEEQALEAEPVKPVVREDEEPLDDEDDSFDDEEELDDDEALDDDIDEEIEEETTEEVLDEEDEDSSSYSLRQMEEVLLPQILENLEQITKTYQKLRKLQISRNEYVLNGEEAPTSIEDKYHS